MSAYREELLAAAKGLSDSLRRAEIAGMNLPYYVDVEWQRLTDAILALAEQEEQRGAVTQAVAGCGSGKPANTDSRSGTQVSAPHQNPAGQECESARTAAQGSPSLYLGSVSQPALPGPETVNVSREHMELLLFDLLPRMSDDDPIAPALADWRRETKAMLAAGRAKC